MPDWIGPARSLLTLGVAVVLALFPAAALGGTVGVELRVIWIDASSRGASAAGLLDPAGLLAHHTQHTGTVQIKADPKAKCFGSGTGGSGERLKLPGATALGAVKDGLRVDGDLRPLSITDSFSFGLGVCAIGGIEAPSSGFWYLKHNHAGATVGGEQVKLRRGDQVLWHLVPDFNQPLPAELVIDADSQVKPGEAFEVTVHQYADDGTRSPAAGVTITSAASTSSADAAGGASLLTDAAGKTTITAGDSGSIVLGASRGTDIAAAQRVVCVSADGESCGQALGKSIFGSNRTDRIKGTPYDDLIKPLGGGDKVNARGGDDVIKVRGGGVDRINCGGGDDLVVAGKNDKPMKNCERVKVA